MQKEHQPRILGWRPFVYGGGASVVAEICTYPLDASKTRLQLQGELISGTAVKFKGGIYRGMFNCLFTVLRNEGFAAIYRGLSAALIRQISYGTIKFGMYNHLKRLFVKDPMNETLPMNMMCAIVSGAFSNAITNPTDVIKIRLQAHALVGTESPSLTKVLSTAVGREGYRVLYRGVIPTVVRASIVCGAELPAYDMMKKHLILSNWMEDTKACHFVSSFVAGFCGALVSNPVDVARTRLMNQRRDSPSLASAQKYGNAFQCVFQTVRNEGILALWKGFIPNWLRLGPWNIIFFMTFEQFNRLPF